MSITHTERVKENKSTSILNEKTNETVTNRFTIENNNSNVPLRNGLNYQFVPNPPETNLEKALNQTFIDAYNTQYNIDRYSGIATRYVPLDGSSSIIHNTTLQENFDNKPKQKIIERGLTQKNEKRDTKDDESSSIIRNNLATVAGIFKNKNTSNSSSLIYSSKDDKSFSLINNIKGKVNNKSSINTSRSHESESTVPLVDRIISTKKERSFGTISNPKLTSFGKIQNNDRTTDLGLTFSKYPSDFYKVIRY